MKAYSTRRGASALLLLLSALLLSACGGPVFRQPQVTLQGVQLAGLGLRGGTLLVNLQLVNPNRFDLRGENLRYQLALAEPGSDDGVEWHPFAEGAYEREFAVEARDSATVQIPVEFTYGGLSAAAVSLLRSGTFDYRATGEVDVRTPLGSRGVPFRRSGTITLLGER